MLYIIKKMLFIEIPKNINIQIGENWIKIKGPLGTVVKKKSNEIKLYFSKDEKKLYLLNYKKKNHFFLSILNNIISGVLKGFIVKLKIIGVGYKAAVEKQQLTLRLGYSNNVVYNIPKNIKITINDKKELTLIIFGNNIQQVKQVAAEIRNLKKPEFYKGKGIRYFNEVINLKEGKKN